MRKQETIEEVAEIYARAFDNDNYKALMQLVIDGYNLAQQQNKNLYSEEDMKLAYNSGKENEYNFINKYHFKARISFEKWFEQFKKKQ